MKKDFDIWIITALLGLVIFSLFNLFGIKKSLFVNQFIYILIGFLFLFLFYKIGAGFFRLNSGFFYLLFLAVLAVTFFVGPEVRGSKRWLNFYFFNFQSSEFLKVFLVIYLSDLLKKESIQTPYSTYNLKRFFLSFLTIVLPVFIIFKQPDAGTALIYFLIYAVFLFIIGIPIRYFIYFLALTAGLILTSWRFLPVYQKNRIVSFLNPNIDPLGISYNIIQSVITIGSGGILGRGLGLGTQSRFLFLPENNTDFAYASLVEQFGFIGGILIIALYMIIIYRLLKKAFFQPIGSFNFLFLIGVLLFLTAQVFINIGMNLGLLPVTGITLPIISYGGSSVVSTMMFIGLAMSL